MQRNLLYCILFWGKGTEERERERNLNALKLCGFIKEKKTEKILPKEIGVMIVLKTNINR